MAVELISNSIELRFQSDTNAKAIVSFHSCDVAANLFLCPKDEKIVEFPKNSNSFVQGHKDGRLVVE